MTHTVEIESARDMDVDGLLAALAVEGLVGEVVEAHHGFLLHIDSEGDAGPIALSDIEHAIERWLDERHVELLPQRVREDGLVLRPASA
jgi:hypothetical protein